MGCAESVPVAATAGAVAPVETLTAPKAQWQQPAMVTGKRKAALRPGSRALRKCVSTIHHSGGFTEGAVSLFYESSWTLNIVRVYEGFSGAGRLGRI